MSAFNHNIKLIRALTGKKQPDFAELIKSNKSNVKTWETTETLPTDVLIYNRLAELAGVTVNDIKNKMLSEKDITLSVEKVDGLNRELPKGDLHVTLKDYVDILIDKARKAEERELRLLALLEKDMSVLKTNSETIQADIEQVARMVRADDLTIMDSQDRIEGREVGTSSTEASIVEHAFEASDEVDDMNISSDKQDNSGKVKQKGKA